MASDKVSGNMIRVEVAYALPTRQKIITLQVAQGSTVLDAVLQSGITRDFPEIEPQNAAMGIFAKALDGKTLPLPGEYQLKEKDRVEIYRPLLIDPKAARLERAAKAKESKIAGKEAGKEAARETEKDASED